MRFTIMWKPLELWID